ncbi:Signal transduction histidine kinase [Desulfonatronum thiosulfatophilum]|uniref:histidine kinase n=1 Tax=Desulfonatronum thiosulfatophilum TaxID=617002 RepID=A0A1G6CCJ9_9BACT|nr:HAMP domain-containing sensor histidine kinase [Desulfonatronum thiosulfatophilum]SDB30624.1 Signal transduction histidine kinase [Desulfonatronum thiosulfatophilum]
MKRPRISLGWKILGLITLVSCIVFFGLFAANFYWKQAITIHQIDRLGMRISELLSMAIDGPMLRGDNDGTHEQFRVASEMYDDIRVYLTDFRGNITYSTEPGTLRQDLLDIYDHHEVRGMLDQSLLQGRDSGMLLELQGDPYYLRVRSIANGPECYHCHGSSQPILGALFEFQNMNRDFVQLRTMQLYGGLIALGGLAILLGCVLLFLRAHVVDRIGKLSRISREIRQGNYSADFNIQGDDEISELGTNLSTMVRRLQAAEKYAAIGEFSTYIAHEIRNPLFAIGGFANTLVRAPKLDATTMQKIQIILSESKRLDDILRIFINFSRPLELTMNRFDVNDAVVQTLNSLNVSAQWPSVHVHMQLDERIDRIMSDPEMVKQCLKNLIKNSISTMPAGGELRVSTREDKDNILLEVADSGHGLPSEVLEQPFNPFTSLELAMTRKIVVDLGGELQLESNEASGTRATLKLPKVMTLARKTDQGEG